MKVLILLLSALLISCGSRTIADGHGWACDNHEPKHVIPLKANFVDKMNEFTKKYDCKVWHQVRISKDGNIEPLNHCSHDTYQVRCYRCALGQNIGKYGTNADDDMSLWCIENYGFWNINKEQTMEKCK